MTEAADDSAPASLRWWGGLVFVLFLIQIPYVLLSRVGTDAAYYLAVARDVAAGSIPYRDFHTAYTPCS